MQCFTTKNENEQNQRYATKSQQLNAETALYRRNRYIEPQEKHF